METALEEESAIFSKKERYKQGAHLQELVCHNCGKTGRVAARCYLKDKKEARVNKLCTEMREGVRKPSENSKSDIKCYNCGETGHILWECRKLRNFKKRTQVIEEYPHPQNVKQLRSFFGINELLSTICAKL